MLKALLKLCLLAIIPLIFLVVSDDYGPLGAITGTVNEKIISVVYKGTFKQIDRKLDGLNEHDRRLKFDELAKQFGMEILLRRLDEVTTSERKIHRLNSGEIVSIPGDGEIVAYKLKNHDLVITIAIEETPDQDVYRSASGSLYLIQQQLDSVSEPKLAQEVVALSSLYDFEFELLSAEQFRHRTLTIELKKFPDVNWSWYRDTDNNEIFVLPVYGEQYVVIHPLQNGAYLTVFIAVVIGVFFLALAFGISLWLWPLWRDHKRLTQGALAFGAGQLDTRVDIRKGAFAADLGRSFNEMADNVQQLISANQQLTNAVAHDLRTPLARLRFASEILDSGEHSEEEAKRYRHTISSSIDALDYLINQTLMHSRYTRSTDIKHFKNANFSEVVHDEVDQFDFEHGDLEFQVNIDESLSTGTQFVDEKALRRALSNLLNNAVRHGRSLVKVSYYMCDDKYCLQVEDDGEGVDEKDFDTIMQPYAQLGNKQRDHSNGLGLGLAIVYQITKWHKGKVAVARSELGGASFTLCWSPILQREQVINSSVSQ